MQKQIVFPTLGSKLNNITEVWSDPFHHGSRDAGSWDLLSPTIEFVIQTCQFAISFTSATWLFLSLKTSVATTDPSGKEHFVHYKPDLLSFLNLMSKVELSSKVTL